MFLHSVPDVGLTSAATLTTTRVRAFAKDVRDI